MGYATVMNVPRMRDYAEALKTFNNSKPIRGRNAEIRPLGDRRYVDTYSVRKNIWTEAIECVLYQTPVVKFTVEDEVILRIDNWPSSSTCQFITRVLGVNANRVRGDVVLHFADGSKALVEQSKELILAQDSNGRWFPKIKQVPYDYRVNRKGANNVRRGVSQFRDYLSGVVKLKGEELVSNAGSYYEQRFSVVKMTYADLVEVFGKDINPSDGSKFRPAVDAWKDLNIKPKHWVGMGEHKERLWAEYRARTEKFYELVKNDQDDNVRHQNYWIAFCILFAQANNLYWREDMDTWASMPVHKFEKDLDTTLMTMFSDKVFTRVALANGKVPTGKYDNYVLGRELLL
jgi:hypothetical protein